jgi:hypothetical protein
MGNIGLLQIMDVWADHRFRPPGPTQIRFLVHGVSVEMQPREYLAMIPLAMVAPMVDACRERALVEFDRAQWSNGIDWGDLPDETP